MDDQSPSQDTLNVPGVGNRDTFLSETYSTKSERTREFRHIFSFIDDEVEMETLEDGKKSNRQTASSSGSKGLKRRLKASALFKKHNSETSTNFYDVENELLEAEDKQALLDYDNEQICTLRREISLSDARHTLWSRDSISDPCHRSFLPDVEKRLLDLALEDDPEPVNDLLLQASVYKNFIECTDDLGRTALHLAATSGNKNVVRALLEKGAQTEVWDLANTATPLMCAASSGSVEALRVLLDWRADKNTGYENGKTALYWACCEGHYDCVKTLLEYGAKQSTTAIFTETPIHVTASRGDPKMLKLLLDYGADVNLLVGMERNTALHLAAQEGDLESCKLLVNAGASIHAQNLKGLTPLHFAAFGNPQLTNFLLISGANPNIVDTDGRTPLFYSVGKAAVFDECLDLLLTHNAHVNLQDRSGYTPFHIAAVKEAANSTSILLRFGADLTIKNQAGQTGLALFSKRVPDGNKIFKEYLNECVTITNINYKANVKLDFSSLVPHHLSKPVRKRADIKNLRAKSNEGIVGKETDLLRCFLDSDMDEILVHPLVEAFLQLKWQRLRKFFILSFLMQMVLVLFYSSFVVEMYEYRCPYSRAMEKFNISNLGTTTLPPTSTAEDITTIPTVLTTTTEIAATPVAAIAPEVENSSELNTTLLTVEKLTIFDRDDDEQNCHVNSYTTWSIVVGLGILTILKEAIQFTQNPGAYVRNLENWALLLYLASLSLTIIPPDTLVDAKLTHLLRYQYPIAAVGVCLAWGLVFIHIGKFPSVGLYVQMFIKVGSNFVTFLLVYGCIMIAFALSLSLLFPPVKTFGSFYEIMLKLIRIMTGDVNLEYIIYDDNSTIIRMPSVATANIIHTTCVVVLSVILMNLLIGLAVNDIQGLYRTAKLKKLTRQAELMAYLESFILSKRFLYFLCPSLRKLLHRSAIVAPTYYKCFFYFHPNDKEDKRLSENLKSALISLKDSNASENGSSFKGNADGVKKLEARIAALDAKIDLLISKADKDK